MRRALLFFLPLLSCAQDLSLLKLEKLIANQKFTEGPLWSTEGYLLFCDVPTDRIMKIDHKGMTVLRENSGGAMGLAFDQQGRLYAAESHARRVTRTDKKGKLEVIADSFAGKKLNGPNDLVVSRNGHLYFTDPAFGKQADVRELDYSVYHVAPKGGIELVVKWQSRPNGIALSPDGKTLYVSNSDERRVYTFYLDHDGHASNGRVFLSDIVGPPDGLRVDPKGHLFVAANSLEVYSPEGKLVHSVRVPEKPSNSVLSDGENPTIYITARSSVYRLRAEDKGPGNH